MIIGFIPIVNATGNGELESDYNAMVGSYDELQLSAFQKAGPLAISLALIDWPDYPFWFLSLKLFPKLGVEIGQLVGYTIDYELHNFSPMVYQELINIYGAGNVDSLINNNAPSQRYQFDYEILMGVAAHLVSAKALPLKVESTNRQGALQLNKLADRTTQLKSYPLSLDQTLWLTQGEKSIVQGVLEVFSELAHWKISDQWVAPEIPEGISENQPWVKFQITNAIGNGGELVSLWQETASDDMTPLLEYVGQILMTERAILIGRP